MDVLVHELDPTDKTGWWNWTQWVVHLGKSDLQHLSTDEPELTVVADAVGQLIEDCVKGLDSARLESEQLREAKNENCDDEHDD
ncbi:hypothetical protein E4U49_006759 [Claviceps purpurea]|nr:hypothetical protein E4U49_006759 [Claviceps purpurea]KAG6304335.1 hypothetical protein E4U45_001694 [Claviceps purpurea]